MEMLKKSSEKICSFYVSEWHFVTMLFPYVRKSLQEEANIVTFLERDIKQNMETLISKMNLENGKQVLEIDWTSCEETEYLELNKKLQAITEKRKKENIILINGSKNYIEKINTILEKWIKIHNVKLRNLKIKIVNCFEVTEFNDNIQEILNSHEKILNTAGEKDISEMFEGYLRTS